MKKFLLTNDDGIHADGIYAIYKELVKLGKVTIVAPDSEKSSVSHGITLSNPLFYKKINLKNKFEGYAVSGTPADCIKIALKEIIPETPDFIISGINLGPNDGCSIFYSGTVAGAREGCLSGIPSIALSVNTFSNPDFKTAAQWGLKVIKKSISQKFPNGTFLNINIPDLQSKDILGIKYTKQGLTPIHEFFKKQKDPSGREYFWMTGKLPKLEKKDPCDTAQLQNKYVTIAPIQIDSTNYNFLNELNNGK